MNFLEMYGYYSYSLKKVPEGREQSSFSYDNQDAILFGGLLTNKSNKVWKFDPKQLTWDTLEHESHAVISRSGHSGVLYQKKLFIFGGISKSYENNFIQDLEIFNLENKGWFTPNAYTKSTLKLRKHHIGIVIGNNNFFKKKVIKCLYMVEYPRRMNI